MEPMSRPVMDIRPQRPQTQPLPRANYTAQAPSAPASAPVQAPEPAVQPQDSAPTPRHEPTPQPPKAKKPVLAIMMALLIGSGLIALTVFAYLKTRKADVATTPPASVTQKATTSDVDSSLKSADDELNKLGNTDLDANSLSDSNLGL